MATQEQSEGVLEAIRRQQVDPDDHDLSLIAESLQRTPEERLIALEQYLEFLHSVRPDRPLIE